MALSYLRQYSAAPCILEGLLLIEAQQYESRTGFLGHLEVA